jgi:hypothetical protein
MPSYYDSTKKKPGTAKVKYNKGGVLGKVYKGNPKILSEEEKREFLDRQKEAQRDKFWLVDEDGNPLEDGVKEMPLRKGGKVKKMKGGGTVARGSGAARPQAFHKNG